jgi:hypothetical protein
MERRMISLTRREFDAVSSALLKALDDAKRRQPAAFAAGFRPCGSGSRRAPARRRPAPRAMRLVIGIH